MHDERAANAAQDESISTPPTGAGQQPMPPLPEGTEPTPPADQQQRPEPPLFGTKESAAGLPYAADASGAYVPGAGPPPVASLAHPGRRLVARLIDVAAVGIVLAVLQTALWVVIFMYTPRLSRLATEYVESPTGELQAQLQQAITPWAWLSALLVLVVWFVYEVPLTAARGQTLGKLALGIKVVGSSATGRVGIGPATGRWTILALPGLVLGVFGLPIQALDCGWMLTDKTARRCLHDRPVKTYVVSAESSANRPSG